MTKSAKITEKKQTAKTPVKTDVAQSVESVAVSQQPTSHSATSKPRRPVSQITSRSIPVQRTPRIPSARCPSC